MNSICIAPHLLDAIVAHARRECPNEACGLLIGAENQVELVIPLANHAPDPQKRFEASAADLYHALRDIEINNKQLTGIYHSHPSTQARLSEEDIHQARLHYPGKVQLIASLKKNKAEIRAWRVHTTDIETLEIVTRPQDITKASDPNHRQISILLFSVFIIVLGFLWVALSLLPPAPRLP